MQGTILIVDAVATNRIALKVKLTAAFYRIVQAESLGAALDAMQSHRPDLVICAQHLPGGGAAALARRLRGDEALPPVPVLAIGNGDHPVDRLSALADGVSDVLARPLDDTLLMGRTRSLIRARHAVDEWQMRDDTTRALGLEEPPAAFLPQGHCMLIHPDGAQALNWAQRLRPHLQARLTLAKPAEAIRSAPAGGPPDVFVLALPSDPGSATAACRLISELRANAHTRHAGLLVVQLRPDSALGATALDLGADDLMAQGYETSEMILRLEALLHRKRMGDQLRACVRSGLEAAVFDPLTGLHNRRYALPHLERIADRARETGRPFAVMVADLDHFKRINDDYGHPAGDAVLVETARRLRESLRPDDLLARIGGEEFLIALPGTTLAEAQATAARLCQAVAGQGFSVPGFQQTLQVTVSIGLAMGTVHGSCAASAETLLAKADEALYSAKTRGRNRVTLSRPAA